jgi:hypothetical protein
VRRVIVALALVAAATPGCSTSGQHRLVVRVNRGPVAFDAPLGLTVTGADPHRSVRITATATDARTTRTGRRPGRLDSSAGSAIRTFA